MLQKHFSTFSPGEKISVETEIGPGILSCVDLFGQRSFGLLANGEPASETQKIAIQLTDSGFEVSLPEMQPGEFDVGSNAYSGTFYHIRPGKLVLEFKQQAAAQAALVVVLFPIYGMPANLQMPAGVDLEGYDGE